MFKTIYYETLPSSNSEAMWLGSTGVSEGTVVVCSEQTDGRGQVGNRWESAPGENLTMSLILRPENIAANGLFLLSKAFSLAVVRSLACYSIEALIKWPNDIYVEGRKIAGILIEHSFSGDSFAFSVIGLGLNVNQFLFPAMDIVPTSITAETGKDYYDVNEILSSVLHNFSLLYGSSKEEINSGYMEKLFRRKGYFPYLTKGGETLIAEIHEVADSGELVLRDGNGRLNSFFFKEIVYVLDE
ncbi:MAG: biotin--[acetyl-CoA-carboxylase] ligase [Prevotellaceae bacterium]|nr:biotin--[acetyl-CoA-carboxylase] ligase [Prevotellaceae bacterium]